MGWLCEGRSSSRISPSKKWSGRDPVPASLSGLRFLIGKANGVGLGSSPWLSQKKREARRERETHTREVARVGVGRRVGSGEREGGRRGGGQLEGASFPLTCCGRG